MAGDPSAAGGTQERGLLDSIRGLLATLVATARTRLELLANELAEERLRIERLALLTALALLFFVFGILFLTLLVIVLFWDSHRIAALGAIACIYLVLGAAFGRMAYLRASERSRLFETSLRELAKDGERLSQ